MLETCPTFDAFTSTDCNADILLTNKGHILILVFPPLCHYMNLTFDGVNWKIETRVDGQCVCERQEILVEIRQEMNGLACGPIINCTTAHSLQKIQNQNKLKSSNFHNLLRFNVTDYCAAPAYKNEIAHFI